VGLNVRLDRERRGEFGLGHDRGDVLTVKSRESFDPHGGHVAAEDPHLPGREGDHSHHRLRHDDGNAGWKNFAPFDRILLSACAERIDERLFAQLADGGILVAPMNRGGSQKIVRFSKISPSEIKEEELGACEFVPLVQGRG